MNELYAYPYNDYRYYLQHSAKGTTWHKEDHKYLYVDENGNYIYEEDVAKAKLEKKATDLKDKVVGSIFDSIVSNTRMNEPEDEYERQAIRNLTASKGEAVTPEKVEKEVARLKEEDRKKAEKEKKKKRADTAS